MSVLSDCFWLSTRSPFFIVQREWQCQSVGLLVHHQTEIKFGLGIHETHMMNWNNFNDP